ncbi:hypothetical protein [Acinetobacter haemolyticus]|uniref:hypothetical protein n=1 Tax=Acinetobacter haemolyticus TaxID=29430 RepID=UPI000F737C62|nr:hypothetical protein [Acinetobacter haemolyticus]RSN75828.1 hypothetical protein EA769_08935 [Acinetobacter haemolyticus]
MSHYFKTELGQTALKQRNIALNARQRRLLLLIDHDDFHELNQSHKDKLAPTELIQQLIEMGLLAEQATSPNLTNEIKINLNEEDDKSPELDNPTQFAELANPTNEDSDRLEKLAFVEIQQLMIQTLSSYCGLMARPLIQQIQQVKTIPELKVCQMQWITSLQESRIPPVQLNQTLKLINYSVEHL